jgi:YVTN family beta-propeller protein
MSSPSNLPIRYITSRVRDFQGEANAADFPHAAGISRGMRVLAGVALLGMMVGAAVAQTVPTPPTALLVLAKKDEKLAIVDPKTLKVVARIAVGTNPHEVAASGAGRTAWVSNYDNGSAHTITVVDLVAQKVTKKIDLGPLWGPHGLAVVGDKTYFTAERAHTIARLDAASESVDWVLGTGQIGTHMLWVSPNSNAPKIVTVNVGSGTMSLLTQRPGKSEQQGAPLLSKQGGVTTYGRNGADASDWEEKLVKVGTYPEGFDVITDDLGNPKTIWVAKAGEGSISIIDFATGNVSATIDAGLTTANRLRFTPGHKLALVSREKNGELAVIDVEQQKVIKQIPMGTGAAGVFIQPDGARAYVSCSPDNWVAVIDLKTMAVVGKIEPGMEPDGLSWAVRQ